MKPLSVINRGENFVTLRATTDRPAEIREALDARGVQHVFKGDQNQAWDAVLANHCLSRAVGESAAETTFFIQDERLGTADARLARTWRREGRRYVLTEDYYRGRAGAVWEHQDISYGLFFTEAVSPEQFEAAGVHLHRGAALWEKHASAALADAEWLSALAALGVTFPGAGSADADEVTRLGAVVNRDTLAALCSDHPAAALHYAFTKTDGLYGLVPVENDNITLSSIPAGEPEIRDAWRRLLVDVAARGALRMAGTAAHRRAVAERVRGLGVWAEEYLAEHAEASVAEFQAALGQWLTREVFPSDRIDLERASEFTRIERRELDELRRPQETLHFFFDLALRHPAEFAQAYNEALNRVGYGLQRVKWEPETGRFTPPFFVEFAPGGAGTPVYRYGVELSGRGRTLIRLLNDTAGDVAAEADRPVGSALAFMETLYQALPGVEGISIVGKAAAFAAELQRSPRGLGLPRQGSKYAPMVDHFVSNLRNLGVLRQPTGLLIRIGLNALDRLDAMREMPLRVPAFLRSALGRTATCVEISHEWRRTSQHARSLLELLSCCRFGQHVRLAKLLAINARGGDWRTAAEGDPRLGALLEQFRATPEGADLIPELGRDLPEATARCLERLLARREQLLADRREAMAAEAERTPAGRVLRPEAVVGLDQEREQVELELLLLYAAYVRRLWQRAESLPYVNDRPYTLALYLLFGRDIFAPICRQVEFDVEYVSSCLDGPDVAPELRETCAAA